MRLIALPEGLIEVPRESNTDFSIKETVDTVQTDSEHFCDSDNRHFEFETVNFISLDLCLIVTAACRFLSALLPFCKLVINWFSGRGKCECI